MHQGVYFTSSLRLRLHAGCELRDRVRLGIDEPVAGVTSFELGEGSVVLSDCHLDCSAPIRIGAGVHIGRRTQIYTHSHDTGQRAVPVLAAPIRTAPVIIEDDVMLYSDVVVLPGVTIGRGAVVAVRAVVTRDVAPYQVVGGIPGAAHRRAALTDKPVSSSAPLWSPAVQALAGNGEPDTPRSDTIYPGDGQHCDGEPTADLHPS